MSTLFLKSINKERLVATELGQFYLAKHPTGGSYTNLPKDVVRPPFKEIKSNISPMNGTLMVRRLTVNELLNCVRGSSPLRSIYKVEIFVVTYLYKYINSST